MNQENRTEVNLAKSNYTIVKAGVKGESTGFCMFGFICFVSPNFADAKADLYQNANAKLEGRSIALANQTIDESSIYLILFSIPRIAITADLVEFKDDHAPKK